MAHVEKFLKPTLTQLTLAVFICKFFIFNFGRSIHYAFVWDDRPFFDRSATPLEGDIAQALTINQGDMMYRHNGEARPAFAQNLSYRPLQFISYWMDFHIFNK